MQQMNEGSEEIQKHYQIIKKQLSEEQEKNKTISEKHINIKEVLDENAKMKKEIKKLFENKLK